MARPRKPPPPKSRRPRGTGSVGYHKASRRWYARVPAPLTRGRVVVTYHQTESEARDWLAAELARLEAGFSFRSDLTLGEYLGRWLYHREPQLEPGTRIGYRSAIRRTGPISGVPVTRLTRQTAQTWLSGLLRAGYSPATVAQTRGIVGHALDELVPEILPVNPVKRATAPRRQESEKVVWSEAQAGRFLQYAASCRFHAWFRLAIGTGMRAGEILGLQWSDLDLESGVGTVRRSRADRRPELAIGPTKTKRVRQVVLPAPVVAALRAHRAQQTVVSPWVFANSRGQPWTRNTVTRVYKQLLAEYNRHCQKEERLPIIPLRDLRHTAATIAIHSGLELPEVAYMLGHANPAITARVYARALESKRRRIADVMGEALPLYGNASPSRLARVQRLFDIQLYPVPSESRLNRRGTLRADSIDYVPPRIAVRLRRCELYGCRS